MTTRMAKLKQEGRPALATYSTGGAAVLDNRELYAPREAAFIKLIETDTGVIKLTAITIPGDAEVEPATVEAAAAVLHAYAASTDAPAHVGAGFGVLHRGEGGLWLLMHWWLAGGIATEQLWHADANTAPVTFEPADSRLMACVWELGVVDFERRAWVGTAMAGKPLADYLASRMPRSNV